MFSLNQMSRTKLASAIVRKGVRKRIHENAIDVSFLSLCNTEKKLKTVSIEHSRMGKGGKQERASKGTREVQGRKPSKRYEGL